ncbi:MAG TPA: ComEC/Rec2 family competence protein [Chthoniobacterales bacterium]|nr:ComEC/Rec2 family competence protein [Chthoniobacterales bacterium]
MNVPRQPFVGRACIAAFGILLADFFPISKADLLFCTIGLFLVALVLFWKPTAVFAYMFVGWGFFLLHIFRTADTPAMKLAGELGDRARTVRVVGVIASEPKIGSKGTATFLLDLESIEFEGRSEQPQASLLVHWRGPFDFAQGDARNPEFGDELKLFGIAEPIAPPRNPGEFDLRSYLERQDVRRSLLVRYSEDGAVLRKGAGNPFLRSAQRSRAWLQRTICRGLDDSPDVQNFLGGIALGLRHRTPEDIEEPFQQTGTLHLFAVAGLHVGIVARLLWTLAVVARLSRKWATGLIILCLLFYATVTGLHVSSVRAAVMCSILMAGFFAERKVFALNSLTAAAFFLLCWNTNEFFSTGFQLSFAVVGGIILLEAPLSRWLQKFGATDPFLPRNLVSRSRRAIGRGYELICSGGSVSLAAWLGSLPLIIWSFHLITPSSVFANLLVVPIAFFILAIALLSVVTAPITSSVSVIFNNANWSLASVVIAFVNWSAQLPGSHYYVAAPDWPNKTLAKISVLDVGAGAAVHLHSGGRDWLLDCGSARDYDRVVRPYLHTAGVNRIDGLLLSHGDSLHIGAAEVLLHDLVPAIVIDNSARDRSAAHRRARVTWSTRHIKVLKLNAGEKFEIAPGLHGTVLFPPRGFAATTADDDALVVQLSVKTAKILFVSDSGYATEKALLASKSDLRSDILVKGQHHSGNSGLDAFLDVVQPQLIIATSRDFPQRERISDEWAKLVRTRGIKLFRQDETGAVELKFNQPDGWQARAYATGETFRSANR